MPATKVLFILKHREQPYGGSSWGDGYGPYLSSGLFNSANFVNEMLQAQGIESKLVHVVDNNAIHREVVAFGATHVIIEAFWVVPSKFDELATVLPDVKFIIRNHSETPFLANEGVAFGWTMEYLTKPNVIISCNALRMLEETRFLASQKFPEWTRAEINAKVPFLPNYYPVFNYNNKKFVRSDTVKIGCFGSMRPLKNHMEQAIGALKFADSIGKKLEFHINGGRIEQYGEPILRNLRNMFAALPQHTFVEHPWSDHATFKELVKTMDIVSQVSFSETFNIVAADAVSQGVPVVVSREVPWVSDVVVADPNYSDDIADKYARVYRLKKMFPKYNPNLQGLKNYNAQSVLLWGRYLGN